MELVHHPVDLRPSDASVFGDLLSKEILAEDRRTLMIADRRMNIRRENSDG